MKATYDFSHIPPGRSLDEACMTVQAIINDNESTRATMLKALVDLGYPEPLLSERRAAYQKAGVHKHDADRFDWKVSADYLAMQGKRQ